MQPIKGITFDLEGTIINLEPLHFGAFVQAVKNQGFVTTFDDIVQNIPLAIGGGDKAIAEGLLKLYSLDMTVEQLLATKRVHYERLLAETEVLPRDGFLNFLLSVRARNISTMIGSLTPRESGERLLWLSGLDTFFPPSTRVFLEDVEHKKPAPDVYLRTASVMGIDPSVQLVFEDSVPGVMAARAAGSQVYVLPIFTMPENLAKLEQAGATKILDHWNKVPLIL